MQNDGNLKIESMKDRCPVAEWQARVDLAACYRLVEMYGMADMMANHISSHVPGEKGAFLINPYGMMYEEITASSLIKVDAAGRQLEEGPYPVNPAGFTIHSAVHAARHEAGCVLHTHSLNGVAVSAQAQGVLPISQHSIFVLNSLGYHDYEGVALRDEEKPRLVQDLGSNNYLMLRNHGLLTLGRTVADAFVAMYFFEAVCTIQIRAQAGGGELTRVHPEIIEGAGRQAAQVTKGLGAGGLSWPGLLRRLDRRSPGYEV